jgi:DNA recombination protein RmuC
VVRLLLDGHPGAAQHGAPLGGRHARQAGQLYDKFAAFAGDIEKVGDRIAQTQKAWDDAHNKLRSGKGNLISRAERLKALGVRASKSLPGELPELTDRVDDDAEE